MFEEGVERCGVVFGWVGPPWYEFGGVGREVPGELVGDVSWVKDSSVTSGVVKMGWRDGCVDVWIVRSVVWGVVVGWGTVSAPRPRREPGDVDFWMLETTVACEVGGSDMDLCLLRRFRVPVECVAVYVSAGRETRLSGRLGLVHRGV